MSDYFNINNDTDQLIPFDNRPGTDLISKMVLTDVNIINTVTKTLVPEAAEGHYVASPNEFLNRNKCDILYTPHNPLSTLPPILVEVQNHVDEKFLTRAIHYSTLIIEKYHRKPIIVIFGVASTTADFMRMTKEDNDFNFARQIPCVGWAKRCLFLDANTLNLTNDALEPIQALGYFFSAQSMSINTLDYGRNDPFMKQLYAIALKNLEQLKGEEDEKLQAIEMICNTSETQLAKIKSCIEKGDPQSKEKALSYLEDTVSFLGRQKRKYCDAVDTTPIDETPPLVYLHKNKKPAVSTEVQLTNAQEQLLMDYIQKFKSKSGRISWINCFQKGHEENMVEVKQFASHESLRSHYNTYTKKACTASSSSK